MRPRRCGIYCTRFFKGDSWFYVLMDNQLPVMGRNADSGKAAFATCPQSWELWVPMIEKGYAKLHNNYLSIVGG